MAPYYNCVDIPFLQLVVWLSSLYFPGFVCAFLKTVADTDNKLWIQSVYVGDRFLLFVPRIYLQPVLGKQLVGERISPAVELNFSEREKAAVCTINSEFTQWLIASRDDNLVYGANIRSSSSSHWQCGLNCGL